MTHDSESQAADRLNATAASAFRHSLKRLVTFGRDHPSAAALLALAAVVFALYERTLDGYFLADDFANVAASSNYPLQRWPSLFFRDISEGVWGYSLSLLRPMAALPGIIQGRLFQADATSYRIVSLALHTINVWLLFAVVRSSFVRSRFVAFAAALLFAVHPVHAETVAWIAGQSDLLPTAMFLGALLAFIRFRQRGSGSAMTLLLVLAACAFFAKESTVVLPFVLVAYDALNLRQLPWKQTRRAALRAALPYLGLLVVLAVYFTCRRIAFGGGAGVPLGAGVLPSLWQTLPPKYAEYSAYLLWRIELLWGLALLSLAAVLLAVTRRRYDALRSLLFFGPAWFVLTTAPFLFTYNYPRHMYVVAAGVCVLIAAATNILVGERHWTLRAVVIGLLAYGFAAANVPAVNRWVDTGIISKNMHRTIRRLASKPEGSIVLLDLPGAIRDAHLFHWSSPFLVGEPFCSPPLTARFIVLEAPISYYDEGRWPQHAAIDQIAGADPTTEVFLVVYDEKLGGRSRRLDTLKVREAAAGLRAALNAQPEVPVRAKWRQFIDSAR